MANQVLQITLGNGVEMPAIDVIVLLKALVH